MYRRRDKTYNGGTEEGLGDPALQISGLKLARFDLARQYDLLYLDYFGVLADFSGVSIGV